MIIDATNSVLGRLSTIIAKQLLKGEEVVIINADKIIITGDPKTTLFEYHEKRRIGSTHHGPYFPRTAEMIVRRTIRGMLPYKTKNGRAAYKRLKVYKGPEGMTADKSFETKEIKTGYITLDKLSKALGSNN